VADDADDAHAVERFSHVHPYQVDKFYVTGTQHELNALGRSIDEHFRWLVDRIKNSKLDSAFAVNLAGTLSPFRYHDYVLWKLEPATETSPVTFDGKFYIRRGPRLDEVSDPPRYR
jgi:hypothetical protein